MEKEKNFITEEDELYIMVCDYMYVWKRKKTSSLKRMNHIEWFVMIRMSGKGKNFITKEDESCIMVCDDMYVWKRKNFITEEDESYIMVCGLSCAK